MMLQGPDNDTTTANGLWREDEGLLRARRRQATSPGRTVNPPATDHSPKSPTVVCAQRKYYHPSDAAQTLISRQDFALRRTCPEPVKVAVCGRVELAALLDRDSELRS